MRTVWGRKAGERRGAELRLKFALTACHRESGRPRRGFWGLPLTQLFPACLPSASGLHIAWASPDAAGCWIQGAPCPARVHRRLFGSHSGCTVLLCDGTSERERPGASDLWGPATSEFGARWHRLRLHCRGPACGVGATATPLSAHPAALRCPGRGPGRGWRQGPRCGLSSRAPLCHAAWSGVRPHCPLRRPCSWPGGHRGCISFPEERRWITVTFLDSTCWSRIYFLRVHLSRGQR